MRIEELTLRVVVDRFDHSLVCWYIDTRIYLHMHA